MADFAWIAFRQLCTDGTWMETALPVESIVEVSEASDGDIVDFLDDGTLPKGAHVCSLVSTRSDDPSFVEGTVGTVLTAMETAAKTKSVQRPRA